MAAYFVVAAGLQYNDPDPIQWAAIYLAAAVVSGLAAARRVAWPWPALVGVAALAWAASFGPRVIASGMLRDVARAMGPGSGAEEAREFLGLAIVVVWMVVVLATRRRSWRSRPGVAN